MLPDRSQDQEHSPRPPSRPTRISWRMHWGTSSINMLDVTQEGLKKAMGPNAIQLKPRPLAASKCFRSMFERALIQDVFGKKDVHRGSFSAGGKRMSQHRRRHASGDQYGTAFSWRTATQAVMEKKAARIASRMSKETRCCRLRKLYNKRVREPKTSKEKR